MKKLSLICSLLILSVLNVYAQAKIVGGEITYEWVADSTYRLNFNGYFDCSATEPNSIQLCITNLCNNDATYVTMNKLSGANASISCASNPSKCDDLTSKFTGIKRWTYTQTYTIPFRCNSWKFAVTIASRDTSVNLVPSDAYFEAVYNNTGTFQGNSSPIYNGNAIFATCISQNSWQYSTGLQDTDGDSIAIEIINPKSGTCASVSNVNFTNMNPPLSIPRYPFPVSFPITVSKINGQISIYCKPTQIGNNITTLKASEYRNGTLIGYTTRDVCIITSASYAFPPILIKAQALSGAFNGKLGLIQSCTGQPMNIAIDIKSSEKGRSLYIKENSFPPNMVRSINNSGSDSIRIFLSWTPSVNDTGIYSYTYLITDSSCNTNIVFGQTNIHSIHVQGKTSIGNDTTICSGKEIKLYGNGVWKVLNGGDHSSLKCYNCIDPIVAPKMTSTYVLSPKGCQSLNDTITIGVNHALTYPSVYITASPSNVVVPGMPVTFTAISRRCTDPKYLWRNNGIYLPFTYDSVYTEDFYLHNNDRITCVVKCKDLCPTPEEVESNPIVLIMPNTGINSEHTSSGISIYPNPNNGKFFVNGITTDNNPLKLTILNQLGQKVFENEIVPINMQLNNQLDLQLPNGVYTLKINNFITNLSLYN